jgi:hypothetical protein
MKNYKLRIKNDEFIFILSHFVALPLPLFFGEGRGGVNLTKK